MARKVISISRPDGPGDIPDTPQIDGSDVMQAYAHLAGVLASVDAETKRNSDKLEKLDSKIDKQSREIAALKTKRQQIASALAIIGVVVLQIITMLK